MSLNIKKGNFFIKQTQQYLDAYNKVNGTNYKTISQIRTVKTSPKKFLPQDFQPVEKSFKNRVKTFFQGLKTLVAPTPPPVLKKILGPEQSIEIDFTDIGNGYSALQLLKRPIRHYISIDKTRSTLSKTYKTNDISCIYGGNNQLEKLYIYNWETKTIRIHYANGEMVRSYTPEETDALLKYKRDSKNIHKVLRYEKPVKNQAEVEKSIESLTKIFNEHKTDVVQNDIIAYRALDNYTLSKIKEMNGDKMIFEDPSFVSVATKKSSVYQFLNHRNYNKILTILIPKGSEYLQMDDIGHIVVPQAPENELLLKGKFLIAKNKGKLEAIFIGDKNIYGDI